VNTLLFAARLSAVDISASYPKLMTRAFSTSRGRRSFGQNISDTTAVLADEDETERRL
jgi:hypothetical protein